ncbi:MAG: four helix bundle protein [Firmicutes bacterium]|nr:four helix bundle protein [Bacillota bacterium]
MKNNIIEEKTKQFAIRIIKLYKYLTIKKNEHILSKQLLRSGTSIGANVKEGTRAISKKEFISKLNISYKEAKETEYWLELLKETNYIEENEYESINRECIEIIKIIVSILKTATKSVK